MPPKRGAKRDRSTEAAQVAELPVNTVEAPVDATEDDTAAPSEELQPVALLLATLLTGDDPVSARAARAQPYRRRGGGGYASGAGTSEQPRTLPHSLRTPHGCVHCAEGTLPRPLSG